MPLTMSQHNMKYEAFVAASLLFSVHSFAFWTQGEHFLVQLLFL